jgi:hypothetical protein
VVRSAFAPRVLTCAVHFKFVEIELYDWHPPIARPDTEAPNPSLGDCAICMDDILLETADSSGGKEASSLLAGVGMGVKCVYAVAPCHHMFVSGERFGEFWLAADLNLPFWIAHEMLGTMAGDQGLYNLPTRSDLGTEMARVLEYLPPMSKIPAALVVVPALCG